ncbi:unnamed protein product, partial [Agarophyton chilense]
AAKLAVARSAFDDVPPPQRYDPAWNGGAPLRAEAGRLASRAARCVDASCGDGCHHGPVLPPAFTLRSSDLDDSDSDHSSSHSRSFCACHSCASSQPLALSPPSHLCFTPRSPLTPPPPVLDTCVSLDNRPAPMPHRSCTPSPPKPRPKLKPKPKPKPKSLAPHGSHASPPSADPSLPPTVFDSVLCAKLTAADIRLLVEHDYHGEVIVERPTDIRARVHTTLDNASTACTVVFSLHQRNHSCRISMRRSFADSFRITNHLFDAFCSEFAARFHQLRHVPQ